MQDNFGFLCRAVLVEAAELLMAAVASLHVHDGHVMCTCDW
jgi:hypothetical protein